MHVLEVPGSRINKGTRLDHSYSFVDSKAQCDGALHSYLARDLKVTQKGLSVCVTIWR